jgi:hypothetical protein
MKIKEHFYYKPWMTYASAIACEDSEIDTVSLFDKIFNIEIYDSLANNVRNYLIELFVNE